MMHNFLRVVLCLGEKTPGVNKGQKIINKQCLQNKFINILNPPSKMTYFGFK